MGKTKTAFVTEKNSSEKTGKEAYEEKMRKKAEKEALQKASEVKTQSEVKTTQKEEKPKKQNKKEKDQVKGVGLKGGERIKVIGAEDSVSAEEQAPTVSQESENADKKERKPKVRSKNYKSAYAKVDKSKLYKLEDAVSLLKNIKYSKFDETVELHIVTKSKGLNTNVSLPYSGGKEKKVEIADEATIKKLESGKVDFDVLLATADMMPRLVPFARILGPKGLMPNPKNGTLIKSKKDAEKFGGNSLTLKTEKEQPVVHTAIGKLSQKDKEVLENAETVLGALSKQLVKVYIKSTMSPSIKLKI